MKNKKSNMFLMVSVFVLLFILMTFRDISIGNDTNEYYRVFNLASSKKTFAEVLGATRYEVGYLGLNYLIGKLTGSFQVLLAVISIFYFGSVILFIDRYAKDKQVCVMLFFTYSLFYDSMNIMRQCIAIGIFLFAVPFLEQRQFFKYVLLIIFAMLFHKMSFVLLILYFIPQINFSEKKDRYKWIVIVVLVLLVINFITRGVLSFFPYYQHYFTDSIYSKGGIRMASVAFFLLRFLILLFVYVEGGFDYQRQVWNREVRVFNQLIVSVCVIAAMSITFNLYDRIENYLCLGYIIGISNAIETLESRKKNVLNIMVVLLTFLYLTITLYFREGWYGIFPYKFI